MANVLSHRAEIGVFGCCNGIVPMTIIRSKISFSFAGALLGLVITVVYGSIEQKAIWDNAFETNRACSGSYYWRYVHNPWVSSIYVSDLILEEPSLVHVVDPARVPITEFELDRFPISDPPSWAVRAPEVLSIRPDGVAHGMQEDALGLPFRCVVFVRVRDLRTGGDKLVWSSLGRLPLPCWVEVGRGILNIGIMSTVIFAFWHCLDIAIGTMRNLLKKAE